MTLVIAGASWALSGDATRADRADGRHPVPLDPAVPIAIVAGISRSAKRGIIVKGGGALETLARGDVLLFDKTGTLTSGVPQVADVEVFGDIDADELLGLAASVDQVSPHVLATAIVRAARDRGLNLEFPDDVHEEHGAGIEAKVGGRTVALGKAAFVTGAVRCRAARATSAGAPCWTVRRACSWPSTVRSPARWSSTTPSVRTRPASSGRCGAWASSGW